MEDIFVSKLTLEIRFEVCAKKWNNAVQGVKAWKLFSTCALSTRMEDLLVSKLTLEISFEVFAKNWNNAVQGVKASKLFSTFSTWKKKTNDRHVDWAEGISLRFFLTRCCFGLTDCDCHLISRVSIHVAQWLEHWVSRVNSCVTVIRYVGSQYI